MSIEQVKSEKDENILVREGNKVVSKKGDSYDVYEDGAFEYFDAMGIKNRIVGYHGGNKVLSEGAGKPIEAPVVIPEAPVGRTREDLLASAELLGLEFPKNIKTPALQILVESAELLSEAE